MQTEKRKTAKSLREVREVPVTVKENLKAFTRMKKAVLKSLEDGEMTVPELAEKLDIPTHKAMFFMMTLQKYGLIETSHIDDDDEYFYYKLKS
jgi:predicted transcriptional regulator